MPSLNIKVGASVDRNLQVAFQPLVEGAKRARAAIEAEGKKGGRAISTETKKGTNAAEEAFKKLEAEITGGMTRSTSKAGAATKQFAKEAKASFDQTKRAFADMARDAEKQLDKMAHAQKKAAALNFGGTLRGVGASAYSAAGGTASIGSGMMLAGNLALGLTKKAASMAIGVAKDLARGAGVETDFGTIARKNFDLETAAQNIANSGYIVGDKRNNVRVDKSALMEQALNVGVKTGTDAGTSMEGLGKFVSKTGDLRTGREIMEQMAIYSKATGSSMGDMMDAAGDLANQLDGVENKSKAIQDLMRGFVGQGKLGAVEIKDLATQMAKIGAASTKFEGGQTAIAEMGVLAQGARGRGGSASASSAANAVASFAAIFSKGARIAGFDKMGVNIEGAGGKIRDPKKIIMDALVAAQTHAGGKLGKDFSKNLGLMFADVKSRQAIGSFEEKFVKAGGGDKGVQAATEEWDRLQKAMVAEEEIMQSFNRAMKTSGSQADVFNAQIQKSVLQMQKDLTPALMALAKEAVVVVSELSKWVTFMTGDKQAGVISDIATQDVDEAMKSTKKMTEGGKISDAQIEQNRVAANEARENKARAAAELKAAQETLEKKRKAGDYDFWTNPGLANKADDANSFWGRTFGANEEGDKKNIEEKKAALKAASETYDKMTKTNEEVAEALKGQLLVKVANVDELKAAMGPGGHEGVQPSPEQKAKQR